MNRNYTIYVVVETFSVNLVECSTAFCKKNSWWSTLPILPQVVKRRGMGFSTAWKYIVQNINNRWYRFNKTMIDDNFKMIDILLALFTTASVQCVLHHIPILRVIVVLHLVQHINVNDCHLLVYSVLQCW